MTVFKNVLLVFFGLGSGMVISAGVFSLISTIGMIPRMAAKTGTVKHIKVYESCITLGGIIGTLLLYGDITLPIRVSPILIIIFQFCVGMFFGELAVSIAEVLNVFPIFMRRNRIKLGLCAIVPSIALGKTVGSLLYFIVQGFH